MSEQDKTAFLQACLTLGTIGEMLGIPEDEVTGDPQELYDAIDALKQQRDELIAALKAIHDHPNCKHEVEAQIGGHLWDLLEAQS